MSHGGNSPGYCFRLGVPVTLLVEFEFCTYFFPSLGSSKSTHLALPFYRHGGGKNSVSFSGVSMSTICRLNECSCGTMMSSLSGKKKLLEHLIQSQSQSKRSVGPSGIQKKLYITISNIRKQPKCPLTDEYIKKMWCICTMKYY